MRPGVTPGTPQQLRGSGLWLSNGPRGETKARYSGPPTANAATRWPFFEREPHPEVTLEAAADGVRGERAQQPAAFGLGRRRDAVVGERHGGVPPAAGHLADDPPRVGQRRPHALDERRVLDLAAFGTLEKGGG
jgi:hypothetical protein